MSDLAAPAPAAISPGASAAPDAPLPLSFSQRRLWFLSQLEPGGLYNIVEALRLEGALDVASLRKALDAIVARHEALRTTIRIVDGEPMASVGPEAAVECPVVDVSTAADLAGEVRKRIAEEIARPFDLSADLMLRGLLLRERPDVHVLVLAMHHAASDGWSVGVLYRELAAFYAAFHRGVVSDLPELPMQYADFARWQRDSLSTGRLERQVAYWRAELADAPRSLDLPSDRLRPVAPSWAGGAHRSTIEPDLAARLRDLARRERATLFMALGAVFEVLLHRYSGQDDVLVGTPIANRSRVEAEPMVGFFANTLVLRGRFRPDPTFRDFLAAFRETALGAYEHPDLPFDRLVEELRPERSASHNPVFQAAFALRDAPPVPEIEGLTITPVPVPPVFAKFDLGLYAAEAPQGGFDLLWEFDAFLFDASRIAHMAAHFRNLVAAVVADPDRRVSELPMLSEEERQRILVEWNATDADLPAATVAVLVEEQARRRPDAIAIEQAGLKFTYAELDGRANRIARLLAEAGVRDGSRVGVMLRRAPETIAVLLAVWKAGAAYVPLDPADPPERRRRSAEDADLALVVAEGEAPDFRVPLVDLARDRSRLDRLPASPLLPAGGPESIAYVLYTSGSTGRPKGVAVPHRAIVRLVRGGFADLSDRQTFLHAAPLAFDASTFEIWGALANGARLVLPDAEAPGVAEIESAIRTQGVTTLWLTAGLFHVFVDERPEALAPLRQLLAGGDVLSPPHVARAIAALPETRIVNGYGPTETTTFACCHTIRPEDPARGTIPIGRPIANTRVYILDRHGEPVPVGVPGEIVIGGAGVASGYRNEPALTAERFTADPFSSDPAARVFHTGDRGRWREDGEIEFLGRLDRQVKIRGFRIEPGEVEKAIGEHPDVREAIVEARSDAWPDRRLLAWVVLRPGRPFDADGLRSWCAERLAQYMVPSRFIRLERLPLSSQGKVDRAALPEPRRETAPAGASPHDTLELRLARIWREILDLPSVSVGDDFFALGGHSLLAVRLFARIEGDLGRKLPLATLFQAPTIERLAAVLRRDGWTPTWSSLVVIQGGGPRPPFFCIPGVGGNVVGFHNLARHLGADQPVYGLQAQGLDGVAAPHVRVEEMAAHYVDQVRAVVPQGPYFIGGASFGGKVAFEMARRLEAEGETVALLALFDTFASPNGSRGPLPVFLRRRFEGLVARTAFHAANLLYRKERGDYLRRKARTVRRRIRSRLWQLVYRAFAEYSWPMPSALRSVREAGYLANRRYAPKPYPGRVTLFRAAVRSVADATARDMGWGELAAGGVDVHHVAGDHENMLIEPHVRVLARELRACIDRGIAASDPKPVPQSRAV